MVRWLVNALNQFDGRSVLWKLSMLQSSSSSSSLTIHTDFCRPDFDPVVAVKCSALVTGSAVLGHIVHME